MKATEVTEPGYYWYWDCGQWSIAECDNGYFFYGDGRGEPVGKGCREFEVVGPIPQPDKAGSSDESQ